MEPNIDNALFFAIISNDPAQVREIIESNPGINLNCIHNQTSLLCHAARQANFDIVKLLIDKGAIVNDKGLDARFKYDTIYATVMKYRCDSKDDNHRCYNIIKYLLEHGADCDSMESSNSTILMAICGYFHNDNIEPLVQLLLEYGANRDLVNEYGATAESIAIKHSNYATAEYIHNYDPVGTKGCYE